jgi:uncharacterized protein YifN (PemK superfamily)
MAHKFFDVLEQFIKEKYISTNDKEKLERALDNYIDGHLKQEIKKDMQINQMMNKRSQ